MEALKIFSLIAFLSIAAIISLLFSAQNPMDKQYQKVISNHLEQQAYPSEEVVLAKNPDLGDIKKQIEKVKQLNFEIQQAMQHPSGPKEEAQQELEKKMAKAQALERIISMRLKGFSSNLQRGTAQIP